MKPIIEVNNVSKKYRIGSTLPYYALRDVLTNLVKHPSGILPKKNTPADSLSEDEFWALRNISFKISPGEVVGIIGRNGAGKTTLLKILSRITPPTLGKALLRGRVASLLEVGTGFHPELTGRENIYLNGAILGMKRKEISRLFDAIVEFAEVEKFLDMPVKHYSSGMYMRLAFAVAAHLNPEILLVDEVLSVGDLAFQRKCLGKIEQVGKSGRTVLFVSHNTQIITRLCNRIILLEGGCIKEDGETDKVMSSYLQSDLGTKAARVWQPRIAPSNKYVRLLGVYVKDAMKKISETIDIRKPVTIEIEYEALRDDIPLVPAIQLTNDKGIVVFTLNDPDKKWNWKKREKGRYKTTVIIPGNLLSEGTYIVRVVIATYEPWRKHVIQNDAVAFYVVDSQDGDSARGAYVGQLEGVIRPMLKWNTQVISAN